MLAPLRNQTFFSVAEVNRAIGERLDWLNDRPFSKLDGSRRSLWLELDRPALGPLPQRRFEIPQWKVNVGVNIDYHFDFERHHYSVPYQLVGKRVDVRATASIVEAFHKGRRIASHRRALRPGGFTTDPSHRPKPHQRYAEWSPSRLIRWAEKIGPETAGVVQEILARKPHPEQGFRSCLGIIRLATRYDPPRVERVGALGAFPKRSRRWRRAGRAATDPLSCAALRKRMRIESRPLAPLAVTIAISCGLAGAISLAAGRFALGGSLLLAAAVLTIWPASIWSAEEPPELSPARRRLALLAVCAIAVFFRTYCFEPPGLWGDDALNGLLAFDILDGAIRSPFQLVVHSNSYFHALSDYPIAAAFRLFGAGPNTLRLPGVVANALSVPLLYGIVAPLFGARVGLVAALFFACSPMQVAHAKSLIQIVLGEFFQLAGLSLVVRGVAGQRRWLAAAAGIPLALCLYTYHSTKIAPLVAVPYLLAVALSRGGLGRRAGRGPSPNLSRRLREREQSADLLPLPQSAGEGGGEGPAFRSLLKWGLAFLAVFAVCALPFVRCWIRFPDKIGARIGGTSVMGAVRAEGLGALWDSMWRTLLVFHYQQGPKYHWFGLGFDPAFDRVVAFLLVPALAATLIRWRESRSVLLLAWLGVGLLPGMLSTEAPRGYRVLLAAPPLYALAAWTLVRIDDFARALTLRSERAVLRLAVLGLLVAVPVLDFDLYFFHTYTSPMYHYFQGERIAEMARTLRRRGRGWTGYVLSDSFDANHECLRFLARCWGLDVRNLASLSDALPVRGVDRGALFMMTRGTLPAAEAMSAWYPDGRLETRYEPVPLDSPIDAWLGRRQEEPGPSNGFFAVSRAMADAKRGARAAFLSNDGTTLASRIDPAPRLAGTADLPGAPDAIRSARWTAVLVAETEGPYRFVLWDNVAARLRIDGAELAAGRPGGDVANLAGGAHLLELDAAFGADPRLTLRWQPPTRRTERLPDAVVFQAPSAGLLAEVSARGKRYRRYETYPFQAFFGETPAADEITWSGRLAVPAAGKRLRVDANSRVEIRLDGQVWHENQTAPPGAHDFELRLTGVPARPILRLEWREPNGNLEPLAAGALTLRPSPRGGP